MCIQDLKMGRNKYTQFVDPLVTTGGKQTPGTQTTIPIPQISWSTPRLFLGANANRTALRLVLANPGRINEETNLFEIRDTYVTGYPYSGEINPIGTLDQPLYAGLSVFNRANMVDQIRIEDFGQVITQAWLFVPMFQQDTDIFFGGYTVWDIVGNNTLMHAVQLQPDV